MPKLSLAAVTMLALTVTACGGDATGTATPSPSLTSRPSVAPSATTTVSPGATPPTRTEIPTQPPPATTVTPAPTGDTGIAGIVTVGPTCPVERADSPCPDRPLAARITVWRGPTLVAETRSGADGRFLLLLEPGTYRVVGETEGTLPRGLEQTVEVMPGSLTGVELRYDSGIR